MAGRPFDIWLRTRGDALVTCATDVGAHLDGLCDSASTWWRSSRLATSIRTRVDRVTEHHERREAEAGRQTVVQSDSRGSK